MKKSLLLSTVSLFAALFFIITEFLPGIPLYGLSSKSKIQISIVLIPIYGLVLGPYLGALSTFLGVILATLYPKPASSIFSYMNILSPTLGTFIVGFVSENFIKDKNEKIRILVIFSIFLVIWFILPIGRMTIPYIIIHIISFLTTVLYLYLYTKYRLLQNTILKSFIMSLSGIMTDHYIGSLNGLIFFTYILEVKTSILAKIYISAIPIIIVERTVMIILSTIFTLSAIKVIPKSFYIRNK